MLKPGRKYSITNEYRYGFNGKENDKDLSDGDQDYGMRIYDGRLGRFLSSDPLASIDPSQSVYSFAGNNTISLTDANGMFRISAYFAKRYPTFVKLLKYVIPSFINNSDMRDKWISNIGFDDKAVGIAAWEEMLTYGSGPWETPTISQKELQSASGLKAGELFASRFGDGSENKFQSHYYPDNISFESYNLQKLEIAIKQQNDKGVAYYGLRSLILTIHGGGHWARDIKAKKVSRKDPRREDGARAEDAIFGMRFTNTQNN